MSSLWQILTGQGPRVRPAVALPLLILSLLVVACGNGATTPALPRRTSTPIAGGAALTDFLGRKVTVPPNVSRIVALSPTTVELVYAVGGAVVGRPRSAEHPEAALSVPDIGTSYRPNLERVAAADPDLVLADSVIQPHLREQLEVLGVAVLFLGVQRFEDVPRALRLAGQALGREEQGEQAAKTLEAGLTALQQRLPAQGPLILILNGTPRDFFAAKPESYAGDLARLLGAENIAAGQPDIGRFGGYTRLSTEFILAANPDVILTISAVGSGEATIAQALMDDPAWRTVPAVRRGRVFDIDDDLFLKAPGPRAGEALETLSSLFYPELEPGSP